MYIYSLEQYTVFNWVLFRSGRGLIHIAKMAAVLLNLQKYKIFVAHRRVGVSPSNVGTCGGTLFRTEMDNTTFLRS